MSKKYIIGLLSISVLLIGTVFLGTSYSLWQYKNTQVGINEVKVGCFLIKYTNMASYGGQVAGDINLVNTYPISDESGAALTPYLFNIKNECTVAADYTINLETMNNSDFNTDYLRVKFNDVNNVTNNGSTIYSEMSNSNIILSGQTSLAKLLTTGHLEKGEDATYSLRLWVDKGATTDTPRVMNKTWNGKVAVSAEAVKPTLKYAVVSGDINTVGSVVKIADEEFYVVGKVDSTHVKLLGRYNLGVGNGFTTPTYKQDSSATGIVAEGSTPFAGSVVYSSSNYWHDPVNPSGEYPAYVYKNDKENEDYIASIAQYVDKYVEYLNNQGVIVSGKLISNGDLNSFGCDLTNNSCLEAPEWVRSNSYWTGSAVSEDSILCVNKDGSVSNIAYNNNTDYGVRPIITLETQN